MGLANKITASRIFLIPIFILILFLDISYKEYISAFVFIVLCLTDFLDGFIARRRKEVTTLGKILDPLADKLLITAALIFLIGRGIEAWMAYMIIARELAVTGLRVILIARKMSISASIWGKAKTISQIVGISAVLMNLWFAWWLMLTATILTIISGIIYFYRGRSVLKE